MNPMTTHPRLSSQRGGRIVGTLVITTCLLLGVVWLLGHLLLALNPGSAIAGEPSSVTSSDSTLAGGPSSETEDKSGTEDNSASENGLNETDSNLLAGSSAESDSGGDEESSDTFESNRFATPDASEQPTSNDLAGSPETERFEAQQFETQFNDQDTNETEQLDSQLTSNNEFAPGEFDPPSATSESDESAYPVDPLENELAGSSNTSFDPPPVSDPPNVEPEDIASPEQVETMRPLTNKLAGTGAPDGSTTRLPGSPTPIQDSTASTAPLPQTDPKPTVQTRPSVQPRPTVNRGPTVNQKPTTTAAATYPLRKWTSIDGKQVEARYESQDAASVILRVGKKRYRVPFARLSPVDLEHLRIIRQTDIRRK